MKNKDFVLGLLLGISIGFLVYKIIDTINDVIVKTNIIKQQDNGN
jgi:predicted small secreted protein